MKVNQENERLMQEYERLASDVSYCLHLRISFSLYFTIKIPEIYSSKFTDFFADFDTKLAPLKVRNYGISISSLEEVFMKIGSLNDLSNLDQ